MAIKLKSISRSAKTQKGLESDFLYKDIQLDIENQTRFAEQLNQSPRLRDIQAVYDTQAVLNSVVTAFTTSKGEKILEPEYGVDMRQYLFEPINDALLFDIETDVRDELPRFEPRIEVIGVEVAANEDLQEINIQMQINIPTLDVYGLSVKSKIDSTGYSII